MALLVKDQLSPEWFAERQKRVTSSIFNEILSGTPKAWSRIIGEKEGSIRSFYGNEATRWGSNHEDEAVALFEMEENIDVERTGFHVLDQYPDDIGGSPDGLIGKDSLIEVKCPFNPEVHLKTFREQKIPGKYIAQVQGNLLITGRRVGWFLSYDPRQSIDKRLVKIPIIRNDIYLDGLLSRVLQFVECWKGLRSPDQYFVKKQETDIFDDSVPKLF
jgi:putative phage-type endonuclease